MKRGCIAFVTFPVERRQTLENTQLETIPAPRISMLAPLVYRFVVSFFRGLPNNIEIRGAGPSQVMYVRGLTAPNKVGDSCTLPVKPRKGLISQSVPPPLH